MRERIHLVKGELSITSQPAGGTTVYARVPFKSEERRTGVAVWHVLLRFAIDAVANILRR